jgi:hypothetical protein
MVLDGSSLISARAHRHREHDLVEQDHASQTGLISTAHGDLSISRCG